jgi:hypothetical protein
VERQAEPGGDLLADRRGARTLQLEERDDGRELLRVSGL